jgi:hypothetical protein
MYLQEIPHDHVADNTLKSLVSQTKGTATARDGRLIKKIYEVDPMVCPELGGDIRIISYLTFPTRYKRGFFQTDGVLGGRACTHRISEHRGKVEKRALWV